MRNERKYKSMPLMATSMRGIRKSTPAIPSTTINPIMSNIAGHMNQRSAICSL